MIDPPQADPEAISRLSDKAGLFGLLPDTEVAGDETANPFFGVPDAGKPGGP